MNVTGSRRSATDTHSSIVSRMNVVCVLCVIAHRSRRCTQGRCSTMLHPFSTCNTGPYSLKPDPHARRSKVVHSAMSQNEQHAQEVQQEAGRKGWEWERRSPCQLPDLSNVSERGSHHNSVVLVLLVVLVDTLNRFDSRVLQIK